MMILRLIVAVSILTAGLTAGWGEVYEFNTVASVYVSPGDTTFSREIEYFKAKTGSELSDASQGYIANLQDLYENGYSFSYPIQAVVEYDPDSNAITRYKLSYILPILAVTDKSFTAASPIFQYDQRETLVCDLMKKEKLIRYENLNDPFKYVAEEKMNVTHRAEGFLSLAVRINEALANNEGTMVVGDKEITTLANGTVQIEKHLQSGMIDIKESIPGKEDDFLCLTNVSDELKLPKIVQYNRGVRLKTYYSSNPKKVSEFSFDDYIVDLKKEMSRLED